MTFLDFIMLLLDVILGHTPLTLPLLSADQTFRLRILHIRRSDFAFCISGVQTSSASHSLAQQIKRSDFVFCISGVQTSPLYGSDVQTSSKSHSLP